MPDISRRQFLTRSCVSMAALAGVRFESMAFAAPAQDPAQETLVILFLRGGMDALNLLSPLAGEDRSRYEAARSNLQVPVAEALPVGSLGGTAFGLHPAASGLHNLFNDNALALVPACGMHHDTRSHFEAMT